jgi:hypothetical protein
LQRYKKCAFLPLHLQHKSASSITAKTAYYNPAAPLLFTKKLHEMEVWQDETARKHGLKCAAGYRFLTVQPPF